MIRAAALLLCAVSLTGCAYLGFDETGNPGNPSATPYAGEPGSIYDADAGPLRAAPPEPAYNLEPLSPMAPQTSPTSSAPLQPLTPTPRAP